MRALRVLVEHLPPDSALARAVLGHDWTEPWKWYLADIRDATAQLVVLTANVNRKQGSAAVSQPKPAWRPETEQQPDAGRTGEDDAELAQVEAELQATADRIFTTRARG